MAYISQETKKSLSPAIKAVLKKYGMKGTIGVRHHSTLIVNIKSGDLDILGAYKRSALSSNKRDMYNPYDVEQLNHVLKTQSIDVNTYWISESFDCPTVTQFLEELKTAMEGPGFFNNDDSMTDYFHRSHYVDINIGGYDKPYLLTKGEPQTFEPVEVIIHPDAKVKAKTPAVETPKAKTAKIYQFPEVTADTVFH